MGQKEVCRQPKVDFTWLMLKHIMTYFLTFPKANPLFKVSPFHCRPYYQRR